MTPKKLVPVKPDRSTTEDDKPPQSTSSRCHMVSGSPSARPSRVDSLDENGLVKLRREASEPRFHTARQQRSRIPRPVSQYRSCTQLDSDSVRKTENMEADDTVKEDDKPALKVIQAHAVPLENFEHYQESLDRLSANLMEVQRDIYLIAQTNEAATVNSSLLNSSATFLPLNESQQIGSLARPSSRMRHQMHRSQSLRSIEDVYVNSSDPQCCKGSPTKRTTWLERMKYKNEMIMQCTHHVCSCGLTNRCCSSMHTHLPCPLSPAILREVKSTRLPCKLNCRNNLFETLGSTSDCQVTKHKWSRKQLHRSSLIQSAKIRHHSKQHYPQVSAKQ